MRIKNIAWVLGILLMAQCESPEKKYPIHWITLDPGHFHAALVQKSDYVEIAPDVRVYAPDTPDVDLHLSKIDAYNSRSEAPTHWNSVVYQGADFFEKMLQEKKGNVVMLSGNNQKKTDYILAAIENGFHVYADKPMAITAEDYPKLEQAFQKASEKGLLLYDIMTERSEITTVLQKELSQIPAVFGSLRQGTAETPAITKESVHHYFKYVSGAPLIRPAWFFDTDQQGEGIADVTTHLVDLTFWECFPETAINDADLQLDAAERWPTVISKEAFYKVTGTNSIPDYLQKNVLEDSLHIFANGSIHYRIKGHHAKVSVRWDYEAPAGTGDTHFSVMRGTKAALSIEQGAAQNYIPSLYVEPSEGFDAEALAQAIAQLEKTYPGIALENEGERYQISIPKALREGHEAHFAAVTKRFISFFKATQIPDWEITNMLSKYRLTTNALILAQEK